MRNALHFIFAALPFLTFAYFCFFLFTKTNPSGKMTRKKKQRNVVYAVCGTLILLSVGMTCLLSLMPIKGGGFRLGIFTSGAVGPSIRAGGKVWISFNFKLLKILVVLLKNLAFTHVYGST